MNKLDPKSIFKKPVEKEIAQEKEDEKNKEEEVKTSIETDDEIKARELKEEEEAKKAEETKDKDKDKKEETGEEEVSEIDFLKQQNQGFLDLFKSQGFTETGERIVEPKVEPKKVEPKVESKTKEKLTLDPASIISKDSWELAIENRDFTKVNEDIAKALLNVATQTEERSLQGVTEIVDTRVDSVQNTVAVDRIWDRFFITHPDLVKYTKVAQDQAHRIEANLLAEGKTPTPSEVLEQVSKLLSPLVETYDKKNPPKRKKSKLRGDATHESKTKEPESTDRKSAVSRFLKQKK